MRSLIILEIEHDAGSTDELTFLIEQIHEVYSADLIKDYAVKVDIPECFVLDSRNDGQGTCQSHTDIHHFTDECVGFQDSI